MYQAQRRLVLIVAVASECNLLRKGRETHGFLYVLGTFKQTPPLWFWSPKYLFWSHTTFIHEVLLTPLQYMLYDIIMHLVVENSLMFNELHESCLWPHFRGKLIENDSFQQYPASAQITIVYSCLTVLCGPGKLTVQINSTL